MYLLKIAGGRWKPGRPHENFMDNKTHRFQTIFGPFSLVRWVKSNPFSTDIRIVLVRCAQWNGLITEVVYFRFYACFICLFAFHPSAKQHVQSRDVEIKNSSRKKWRAGVNKGSRDRNWTNLETDAYASILADGESNYALTLETKALKKKSNKEVFVALADSEFREEMFPFRNTSFLRPGNQ